MLLCERTATGQPAAFHPFSAARRSGKATAVQPQGNSGRAAPEHPMKATRGSAQKLLIPRLNAPLRLSASFGLNSILAVSSKA